MPSLGKVIMGKVHTNGIGWVYTNGLGWFAGVCHKLIKITTEQK